MVTFLTSTSNKNTRFTKFFQYNNSIILLLILSIISLLITTIIFAVLWQRKSFSSSKIKYAVEKGLIGFAPILPDDGEYVQWTILQLNDIYEMLPLDNGKKGGLARVARVRQLLLEENPFTYTILAGDFLSPSALSQSIVNGTLLNGRQMIASLNTLGVDFVTFGNHEFDLNKSELIRRMNESRFTWISSNINETGNDQPFSSSIRYKIIHINKVRILLIGLTIDVVKPYVKIINQTELIPFVQQFLQSISSDKYDVLIALTHLDMATDIKLSENIPQMNLILGGHEHEDYYLYRGSKYTPISKADGNAFTVYIHRCAFNLNTKQFRLYSTLTKITSQIPDEPLTAQVINYWYHLGIKGFEQMGFKPNQTVSCLPSAVELDGRSASVRNFPTLLSKYCCECLIKSAKTNNKSVGIFNSGTIRIDDILRERISEYDILRTLPFQNNLVSLSVPGEILANVLSEGMSCRGGGMFLSYCGIERNDEGKSWFINGMDIRKSNLSYDVVTIDYMQENSNLNDSSVIVLEQLNLTHARSLINYLEKVFPPC